MGAITPRHNRELPEPDITEDYIRLLITDGISLTHYAATYVTQILCLAIDDT